MLRTVPPFIRWILTTVLLATTVTLAGCGRSRPMNVLLVTFDTTRADRFGCYGDEDIDTPTVDSLAHNGTMFENAYAAVPITAPSHSTILTGTYPMAHGVRDNGMFTLQDEQITLAELLQEHGYATAGAVASFPVIGKFGFGQGFDLFDDHVSGRWEDIYGRRSLPKKKMFFDERKAALVNEAVLPWLETTADKPFFLWVHYFDPHQPLDPPSPYDQLYAADPYRGEIAYADESLGILLKHLETLGQLESTLVVMTADHGEGLGDHNELTHAMLAYNSTVHVPLVMQVPGRQGGRVIKQPVGTVDIVPTILDLLDLPLPSHLQGRSLAPLTQDGQPLMIQDRELYAENLSTRLLHGWGELRVLYDNGYKYIHGPRQELYRLEDDPAELHNLIERSPETAAAMQERLSRFLEANAIDGASVPTEMSEDDRQRLLALGYLTTTGSTETIIEELRSDGIPPHERVGDVNGMSRAKAAMAQEQYLEAQEQTLKLLSSDPGNPRYLELYASAAIALGKADEAWQTIEKIAALYSAGAVQDDLIVQLTALRFEQGDKQQALTMLSDHQAGKTTAAGQYLLSLFHAELGNPDKSLEALIRSLEILPIYTPARLDLAIHHAQQGDTERAEQEFRRALEDDPYSAKAHYNYGAFLVANGWEDEAMAHFRRTVKLAPHYWRAYLAVVAVGLDLGDQATAGQYFEQLRSMAPQSPEAAEAEVLMEESP